MYEQRRVRAVPSASSAVFPQKCTQNQTPECFMRSKSVQNLTLMPNILSDYVGYKLNLIILAQIVDRMIIL